MHDPYDEAIEKAKKEAVANFINLLDELTSEEDCWFDHHGGCQAHYFLSLEPGQTCPHQDAKELIAKFRGDSA